MSCHNCATSFSIFKKEHGCHQCGFAFCQKCLQKKAVVPGKGKGKQHVCNHCYSKLMGNATHEKPISYDLPENFVKRLEALNERGGVSGTSHSAGGSSGGGSGSLHHKSDVHCTGMTEEDIQIAKRLEQLKQKPKSGSQAEVEARLANLKGEHQPSNAASSKPIYRPPDSRTQVEQVSGLLHEMSDQVELDKRWDPVADVTRRLEHLRDHQSDKPKEDQIKSEKSNQEQNDLNRVTGASTPSTSGANIPGDTSNIDGSSSCINSCQTDDKNIDAAALNKLLQDASQEVEAEARRALEGLEKDNQIRSQLEELRKRQSRETVSNTDITSSSDVEDDNLTDEQKTERLIQQILEQDRLDALSEEDKAPAAKKVQKSATKSKNKAKKVHKQPVTSASNDVISDDEELPWCCICNEDATLRCHGCENDLYCSRCFREAHDQFDMDDHKSSSYSSSTSKTT